MLPPDCYHLPLNREGKNSGKIQPRTVSSRLDYGLPILRITGENLEAEENRETDPPPSPLHKIRKRGREQNLIANTFHSPANFKPISSVYCQSQRGRNSWLSAGNQILPAIPFKPSFSPPPPILPIFSKGLALLFLGTLAIPNFLRARVILSSPLPFLLPPRCIIA